MKQYYVVYASKDTGYYETAYWVVCVTESLDVAKDLCNKFGYNYEVEKVGEERNTPDYVKSREPHKTF